MGGSVSWVLEILSGAVLGPGTGGTYVRFVLFYSTLSGKGRGAMFERGIPAVCLPSTGLPSGTKSCSVNSRTP